MRRNEKGRIFVTKQGLAAFLAAGMILSMAGCTPAPGSEAPADIEAVTQQILDDMSDEEKNWMGGLTREERLEDFDALCRGLEANYPYLELARRQTGADLDELAPVYREQAAACTNDDAFDRVLGDFIGEFGYTGHLELWGRRYRSQLEETKQLVETYPEHADHLAPYIAALDNPVSQRTYAGMEAFYAGLQQQAEQQLPAGAQSEEEQLPEEETANLHPEILEEGRIAYLGIDVFDLSRYEEDAAVALPFYEQVKDYDHLIIDISQNPGGSMSYFNDLVVAPLARETLTVPTYQLFKDGENNREFLQIEKGLAEGSYRPIEELPVLPNLNVEDAAQLNCFFQEDYTVVPTGDGFSGKIWLLVSENNYSSSEYAAMFSKQTGFATLVGNTTSGDGIGTDPAYLILPNSGLVVQYSPMYGVTSDGTGSEEFGTRPDILSPEGETPLETCLRAIAGDAPEETAQ